MKSGGAAERKGQTRLLLSNAGLGFVQDSLSFARELESERLRRLDEKKQLQEERLKLELQRVAGFEQERAFRSRKSILRKSPGATPHHRQPPGFKALTDRPHLLITSLASKPGEGEDSNVVSRSRDQSSRSIEKVSSPRSKKIAFANGLRDREPHSPSVVKQVPRREVFRERIAHLVEREAPVQGYLLDKVEHYKRLVGQDDANAKVLERLDEFCGADFAPGPKDLLRQHALLSLVRSPGLSRGCVKEMMDLELLVKFQRIQQDKDRHFQHHLRHARSEYDRTLLQKSQPGTISEQVEELNHEFNSLVKAIGVRSPKKLPGINTKETIHLRDPLSHLALPLKHLKSTATPADPAASRPPGGVASYSVATKVYRLKASPRRLPNLSEDLSLSANGPKLASRPRNTLNLVYR